MSVFYYSRTNKKMNECNCPYCGNVMHKWRKAHKKTESSLFFCFKCDEIFMSQPALELQPLMEKKSWR